jgi:hypothetical protein
MFFPNDAIPISPRLPFRPIFLFFFSLLHAPNPHQFSPRRLFFHRKSLILLSATSQKYDRSIRRTCPERLLAFDRRISARPGWFFGDLAP